MKNSLMSAIFTVSCRVDRHKVSILAPKSGRVGVKSRVSLHGLSVLKPSPYVAFDSRQSLTVRASTNSTLQAASSGAAPGVEELRAMVVAKMNTNSTLLFPDVAHREPTEQHS
jgi:hypothetical protein